MSDYRPRHARPDELPEIFWGLANLIQVVPSKSSSEEN